MFQSGDILFSYETDKAAFDLESPADGILLDIFFDEGAEVPVLANVAVIGKSGEESDSFNPEPVSCACIWLPRLRLNRMSNTTATPPVQQTKITSAPADSRIRISPRAKRLAEDKGINFNKLSGSGPNGRILTADIENIIKSWNCRPYTPVWTDGAEYTEQPLSNVRKLIAKAMHSSLQNSAQLTHHMSADVRQLLEARQKIKDEYFLR